MCWEEMLEVNILQRALSLGVASLLSAVAFSTVVGTKILSI